MLEDPPFVAVTRSLLLGLSIKFFVWIAEDFGTIQDVKKKNLVHTSKEKKSVDYLRFCEK